MRWTLIAAALLVATQAATQATAQPAPQVPPTADPGVIQQRRIEEERRREELERLQKKPEAEPIRREGLERPAARPATDALRFLVREIRFTKSDILGADALETVAREFRGRTLSLADLQQLTERVNALYKAKGVVTAQAVIPPQDVSAGIVTVRLVEGRVGKVSLQGNASTREGYVTDRLSLRSAELVDLPALERDLSRFNRSHDAQLRAELKPGQEFATTDVFLALSEPPQHDLRLFADNGGSESTGEWRGGLTYLNRSLFGWRDELSLTLNTASGQEGYAASYAVPMNRWGGRAGLAWYKDRTASKYGPLATLDITGASTSRVLTLRQPVHFGERLQVDLLGGGKSRSARSWTGGLLLQGTDTDDVNLGVEAQLSDPSGVWLMNYTLASGRARVAGVDGRDRYDLGRGTLRRLHDLSGGWSLRGSLNFQNSSNVLLPSSEQFFIGGEYSVRGYPTGVYAGDQGYALNLELHHALPFEAEGIAATGFVLLDKGYVKVFRPPDSLQRDHEELAGVGFGVNATLGKRFNARLTLAYALNALPTEPRRYAVHVQVVAGLF